MSMSFRRPTNGSVSLHRNMSLQHGKSTPKVSLPRRPNDHASLPRGLSDHTSLPRRPSDHASLPRSLTSSGHAHTSLPYDARNGQVEDSEPQPLEKSLCVNHLESERRPIELYCLQCHVCLCWKCKHTFHNDHRTEEVATAVRRVTVQVAEDQKKLKHMTEDVLMMWRSSVENYHDAKSKAGAVKAVIEERHKLLIDIADRFRDEALTSLDTVTTAIRQSTDNLSKAWTHLDDLYGRMEMCTKGTNAAKVLLLASKIYGEWEKSNAEARRILVENAATRQLVATPTLNYSLSSLLVAEESRRFIGTVIKKEWPASTPVVRVTAQFHSKKGKKRDIFAILVTKDAVCLSYDVSPADGVELMPDMFSLDGKELKWPSPPSRKGRASFTLLYNGTCGLLSYRMGDVIQSYAKSRRGVLLQNGQKGTATVMSTLNDSSALILETVQLGETRISNLGGSVRTRQLTLPCGLHRSFDIHHTKHLVVVVEESEPPSAGARSVAVIINGEREVYQPPALPYQPSDVCFHQLGQRDVLLVADELNDAIHVVDIRTGKFLRYLAPGHPLVVQPTALNVDTRGRLWVACRGGAVLLCEPV